MNATTNATIPPSFSPTGTLTHHHHKPLPDWSNAPWALGAGRAPTTSTCPPKPTASPSSFPTLPPNFVDDFLRVPPSPNPRTYFPPYRYNDDDGRSFPFAIVGTFLFFVLCGCGFTISQCVKANRNTTPSTTIPIARLAPTNATATTARANGTTAQTRAAEQPARLVGGMNLEQREEHVKKSLTSVTIHLNGQESTTSSLRQMPSAPRTEGSTQEDEDKCDDDQSVAPAEISEVNMCSICCSDFENGDKVSFSNNPKCEHSFHTDCIAAWLKNHQDCPMCRQMFL